MQISNAVGHLWQLISNLHPNFKAFHLYIDIITVTNGVSTVAYGSSVKIRCDGRGCSTPQKNKHFPWPCVSKNHQYDSFSDGHLLRAAVAHIFPWPTTYIKFERQSFGRPYIPRVCVWKGLRHSLRWKWRSNSNLSAQLQCNVLAHNCWFHSHYCWPGSIQHVLPIQVSCGPPVSGTIICPTGCDNQLVFEIFFSWCHANQRGFLRGAFRIHPINAINWCSWDDRLGDLWYLEPRYRLSSRVHGPQLCIYAFSTSSESLLAGTWSTLGLIKICCQLVFIYIQWTIPDFCLYDLPSSTKHSSFELDLDQLESSLSCDSVRLIRPFLSDHQGSEIQWRISPRSVLDSTRSSTALLHNTVQYARSCREASWRHGILHSLDNLSKWTNQRAYVEYSCLVCRAQYDGLFRGLSRNDYNQWWSYARAFQLFCYLCVGNLENDHSKPAELQGSLSQLLHSSWIPKASGWGYMFGPEFLIM